MWLFFYSPGTEMLHLCGLYQPWTYSVLESWRMDKERSMEINVEIRGPRKGNSHDSQDQVFSQFDYPWLA